MVREIAVTSNSNSKAEYFYCPTEEGKKIIDGTEAFDRLIKLREKILNNERVKKLREIYSKEEPKIEQKIPDFIKGGKIIREDDNFVSVVMYGDRVVNLIRKELERIDSTAKELGRFKHSDLVKAIGNDIRNVDFKIRAYIVYAYEKGLIDIVDSSGKVCVYERKID